MSVFFPELVKVCNFLLVRFDIRNLDEPAWAENEHLAFGFELCKFVKCLVVADMARGNRFDKFGVMAVGEFYKRESFVDFFAVAERACQNHYGAFKSFFEHLFERDAVGNATVKEFFPVNFDDFAQNRHACGGADVIHLVFVAIVGNARVFG